MRIDMECGRLDAAFAGAASTAPIPQRSKRRDELRLVRFGVRLTPSPQRYPTAAIQAVRRPAGLPVRPTQGPEPLVGHALRSRSADPRSGRRLIPASPRTTRIRLFVTALGPESKCDFFVRRTPIYQAAPFEAVRSQDLPLSGRPSGNVGRPNAKSSREWAQD